MHINSKIFLVTFKLVWNIVCSADKSLYKLATGFAASVWRRNINNIRFVNTCQLPSVWDRVPCRHWCKLYKIMKVTPVYRE
jgi:hypothetical protein